METFAYRFAELVDGVPTGTFVEADAPSLVAAVIDVAGMELEDASTGSAVPGGLIPAEYDFTFPYGVRFANVEYRLLYGPRSVAAPDDACPCCGANVAPGVLH
jgi:hypothetical protein